MDANLVRKFNLSWRNWNRVSGHIPDIITTLIQKQNVILAGGSLRCVFDGTTIQDYDIFFKDEIDKEYCERILKANMWENVFMCSLGKLSTWKLGAMKIQLITPMYYRDAEHLLSTFDITAAMFAWDCSGLYTSRNAIYAAKQKFIDFNSVPYPIATYKRIEKYKQKGYSLSNEAVEKYLKMTVATANAYASMGEMFDDVNPESPWRFYID